MNSFEKASACWGDTMPEWIKVLAEECDKSSQRIVSEKIRYSKAAVSLVLSNTYKGTIAAVKSRVETILMNAKHSCPVYGEILTRDCQKQQQQGFASSGNPAKIRLFKACQKCEFNKSRENPND